MGRFTPTISATRQISPCCWAYRCLLHKHLGAPDAKDGFDEITRGKVFPHVSMGVYRPGPIPSLAISLSIDRVLVLPAARPSSHTSSMRAIVARRMPGNVRISDISMEERGAGPSVTESAFDSIEKGPSYAPGS